MKLKNILKIIGIIVFVLVLIETARFLAEGEDITEYILPLMPILLLLVFLNNKIGIILLIIILPFSPRILKFLDYDITVTEVIIFVVFLAIWLRYITRQEKPEKMPYRNALLYFTVANILSICKSAFTGGFEGFFHSSLLFMRIWIELFILVFIFYSIIKTERMIFISISAILIVGFAGIFYSFITFKITPANFKFSETRYASGNTFALYIIQLLLIALSFGEFIKSKILKILLFLLAVSFFFFIFQIISRTGIIVTLIGTVMVIWFRNKRLFYTLIIISVIGIVSSFLLPIKFTGRYERLNYIYKPYQKESAYFKEYTIIERAGFGTAINNFFLSSDIYTWFFGIGYYTILKNKLYSEAYNENSYLGILGNSGIIGLIFFLLLIKNIYTILNSIGIAQCSRLTRAYFITMHCILISFLIGGLTTNCFYSPKPANLLFPLLGILFRVQEISQKKGNELAKAV